MVCIVIQLCTNGLCGCCVCKYLWEDDIVCARMVVLCTCEWEWEWVLFEWDASAVQMDCECCAVRMGYDIVRCANGMRVLCEWNVSDVL